MTASGPRSMLPPLGEEERLHSQRLVALVQAQIAGHGGWLPFERFMELALYAPGLGYYSAGSVKIGAAGDFVTAPEVSDLFSRCVALQCGQVLDTTGGDILELGAGTGRMAEAMLRELDARQRLPDRYLILEVSADLAARQRERLARLPAPLLERVSWLSALPGTPLSGVVLANEVADALPCRRVRLQQGQWQELGVAIMPGDGGAVHVGTDGSAGLIERAAPADAQLQQQCQDLQQQLPQPLPDDYETELCPRLAPWIASLSDSLARGAILVLDYGLPRRHYYHPQRNRGTLVCHFRQRLHHDPCINVGVQDITAWVDFTAIAEAADAVGLTVAGFATQAGFLLGLGLPQLLAEAGDERQRLQLAGEARRLLLPGEMGEAFKVMALTRALDLSLTGMAQQDLRHLL